MTDSFSYNGIDMSDPAYGITLLESPIETIVKPRINVIPRSGDHGAIVRGSYVGERTLSLDCVVQADNWDLLQACLEAIRGVLVPGYDRQLILDHTDDRYLLCRLSEASTGELHGTRAAKLTLTFVAGDPLWYGTTEHTNLITNTGGFNDWSVALGGTPYAGTADTPITFTLHQISGTGHTTGWYVQNANESSDYAPSTRWGGFSAGDNWIPYTIGEGNHLRFNSDTEMIEVSTDEVTWTSVMAYRSITTTSGSDVYVCNTRALLHPGENWFTCVGGRTSYTWEYSYYDRWL